MGKNDSLSGRQLAVTAFIGMFSPMLRVLPGVTVLTAGPAAWLCPLVAAVPSLLYIKLLQSFLKNRAPGEGMSDMFIRAAGKAAGAAVSVLFAVCAALYAGFELRSSAERLVTAVYEYGGAPFFAVVTLAVALVCALGPVKYAGRTAEVFLPILLGVFVFVLAFSLFDLKGEYLTPVSVLDAGGVALGALDMINYVGSAAFFTFLYGYVPKNGPRTNYTVWAACIVVVMTALQITVTGTMSAPVAARLQNPFFTMVRNISVFGVAERLESLVVALWVGADIVFISSLLSVSGEIMGRVSSRPRRAFVWAAAAAALLCCIFVADSTYELRRISRTVVPYILAGLNFFVIPLLFFIGRIRKKI